MRKYSIIVAGESVELAESTDVDALRRQIVEAVHGGGGLVDVATSYGVHRSFLVARGLPVIIASHETPHQR